MKDKTHHLIPSIFYHLIIIFQYDIAQGTFFRGKRSGRVHNSTMDVDPGYKYTGKNRGGLQWYKMGSKDST